MKKITSYFTYIMLSITLIMVTSCSDDDNGPTPPGPTEDQNIFETADDTSALSSLVAALKKADESANNDLEATLSNEDGTFTVLAPTNDAFDDLFDRLDGYSSLDDFDTQEKQDLLGAILSYHVFSGDAVTSDGLSNEQELTMVQGENVTVSTEGGTFFIDAAGEPAEVTTANEMATNGVIHIIDKVLIPQQAIDALEDALLFSIVDIAISDPNLGSLVAALQAADGDLPSVLQGDGPFTVLAPTNAAFTAFLDGQELSSVPTDVLAQVLLNHVIPGEVTSTMLTTEGSGYASTSANGPVEGSFISIFYDTSEGVRFNNASSVEPGGADIKAINGMIHKVDAVIGLPNIVDHAVANSDFSELVGLLTANDDTTFTDLLSGTETNYTVFAPINSAIEGFITENEISNVLSNHVVAGTVALSTGLETGYDISTEAVNADDDKITLYVNTDEGVRINGVSSVAEADIVATNGVIHAVDAVIDIPTVTTFATANPNFSTLVSALTELTPGTDFEGILSRTEGGNGDAIDPPFTVFAPTNTAFEALDEIPEEAVLTQVLLHHVVDGANVRSEDLNEGANPTTTLEGDGITITLPGSGDNIADITDGTGNADIGIVSVDVQAGNGVIHVINKVMIPNTDN